VIPRQRWLASSSTAQIRQSAEVSPGGVAGAVDLSGAMSFSLAAVWSDVFLSRCARDSTGKERLIAHGVGCGIVRPALRCAHHNLTTRPRIRLWTRVALGPPVPLAGGRRGSDRTLESRNLGLCGPAFTAFSGSSSPSLQSHRDSGRREAHAVRGCRSGRLRIRGCTRHSLTTQCMKRRPISGVGGRCAIGVLKRPGVCGSDAGQVSTPSLRSDVRA
jgi:hypothetical protein